MIRASAGINRFVFGEVSPLLAARNDLAKYGAACRTLVNFIPLLQGPVQRRGGTRFIAECANGDRPVVLIDFAFSETTTYILEAGDGYLRFFRQGQPVLDEQGRPYQITTPWRQADLFYDSGIRALRWVQSGDVMYLVCPGRPPQKLSRHGHTDWRVEELPGWNTAETSRPNPTAVALFRERLCLAYDQTVCLSQSGAFENFELANRSIPGAALTQLAGFEWVPVIDSEAATIIYRRYTDSVDGAIVSFQPGEVLFSLSGQVITIAPADPTRGLSRIDFGVAPDGWTIRINPLVGELVAGGIVKLQVDPNRSSISADPAAEDKRGYIVRGSEVPIAADDPIEIKVYSEQMNRIEWLCPAANLLVGTTGGEFIIGETTTVDPLGPENVKVAPETAFGSSAIAALRVGSVILFVQRSGRKLREFAYDYAGDNYQAMDLTVAAEHITHGGLSCLVWQSEPVETLWAARSDGQLLGFTYSKDQDMTAWHRHQLGGGGQVSQLAVVPAAHGGRDELWLTVKRTVNNREIYTLERMEPGHELGNDRAEAFFVDSGLTRVGSQMTEVEGLEHLEGLEVAILADGGVQPPQLVAGGRVALQYPADLVQVGLAFESRLTTVNLDLPLQDGTAQARRKRLTGLVLRLVESGGGMAGPAGQPDEKLQRLEYRRGHDRQDQAPPLFTGDRTLAWPGGWETDGAVTVVQTDPLPLTVAAIIPQVNIDNLNA